MVRIITDSAANFEPTELERIIQVGAFFVGKLSKYRLRKAEAVVAPTQKVETVLKNYGVRNPIFVVHSGIALEQHKERISEEERREKRNALVISEDRITRQPVQKNFCTG